MSHATKHLQMSIFASNTPMALVVVDDALGVFRVDINPELRGAACCFVLVGAMRTGSLNTKSLGSDVAGGASPE